MEEFTLEELLGTVGVNNIPTPGEWQYFKGLRDRRIIINQEIDDDLLETAILPYVDMDNDGSGQPIEIVLSTVGGNIYSGFALIDVIERTSTPTIIHIYGMAASMGMYIAMAGHNNPNVRTVCHPFSVGLIHAGSSYLSGTAHQVRDTFNFSEHYEKKIHDYVLSHSNIDEKYYDEIDRKELWVDAEEMLRLGIVDEII